MALNELTLDAGTQPRVEQNDQAVADYAAWLGDHPDEDLPPIQVYRLADKSLVPWDGFHRIVAYRDAGRETIPAEISIGTLRDAILRAAGANATHGLRRSNADKRRAVEMVLRDAEWAKWSDREVARACAVGHSLVGEVRAHLAENTDAQEKSRKAKRNGKEYEVDTKNIGKTADNWRKSANDQSVTESVKDEDADDSDTNRPVPSPKRYEDGLGNRYPESATEALRGVSDLAAIQRQLSACQDEVRRMGLLPVGACLDVQGICRRLDEAHKAIRAAKPYRVCPTCKGETDATTKCESCKGRGWVTEQRYAQLGDTWGDR